MQRHVVDYIYTVYTKSPTGILYILYIPNRQLVAASQVSTLAHKLKAEAGYLSVLTSPVGLCVVSVFLAAIGAEFGNTQGHSQRLRIV